MQISDLKELINRELPALMQEDPSLRNYVLELSRDLYADKTETEDRFAALLNELRRDREEQTRKWEEQLRMWEENSKHFSEVHEEIMAQAKKFDRSIGALEARWGIKSENAFRQALAGILEENFGVEVVNVNEYDESGEVFGRPEQVELDLIIKNGLLIICELKSSMSKSDMYLFERKARFYEKRHQCRADSLLVISPMIDPKAEKVARDLGIKTYSDSSEVEEIV
jgi:hypothetical protein